MSIMTQAVKLVASMKKTNLSYNDSRVPAIAWAVFLLQ